MKAIQIMFDEGLLARLDQTREVRARGRSAVLRDLARDFLDRQRSREIDAGYERAYRGTTEPLGAGFDDWSDEGVWPPE